MAKPEVNFWCIADIWLEFSFMQANLLTNVILPLSLAIIMLGMGLSLQGEEKGEGVSYEHDSNM